MPGLHFLVGCRVTSLDFREDRRGSGAARRWPERVCPRGVRHRRRPSPERCTRGDGARYEGTHAQRPNLGVMFRSVELIDLLPIRQPLSHGW